MQAFQGIDKSSSGDDHNPSVLALDDWLHLFDVPFDHIDVLHVTGTVVDALSESDEAISACADEAGHNESVIARQVELFIARDFALSAENVDGDHLGIIQVCYIEDNLHSRELQEVVVAVPEKNDLKN